MADVSEVKEPSSASQKLIADASEGKEPSSASPDQKLKKPVLRHHQCQHCDKTFDNTTDKRRHELVHTGNKPYQCQYCGKCFNRVDNKRRHELGHTKGSEELPHNCAYCARYKDVGTDGNSLQGNPNQCNFCRKIFARPCFRKTHEQYAHSEDKPHQCQFCNMRFVWESQKNKHEGSHSQERPQICEICSKSFKNLSHLKHHEKTHTGERNHRCQFCEKAFLRQTDKEIHEKRHTGEKPLMCSYCGMRFTGSGSLKYHEMIHTGDKPHKCEFCDKRFITSRNKKRHEMVHTGEKPHECKHCGKGFITRRNRNSHERVHMKHGTEQKDLPNIASKLSKFEVPVAGDLSKFGVAVPFTPVMRADLLSYAGASSSLQYLHPNHVTQQNSASEFNKDQKSIPLNANLLVPTKATTSIDQFHEPSIHAMDLSKTDDGNTGTVETFKFLRDKETCPPRKLIDVKKFETEFDEEDDGSIFSGHEGGSHSEDEMFSEKSKQQKSESETNKHDTSSSVLVEGAQKKMVSDEVSHERETPAASDKASPVDKPHQCQYCEKRFTRIDNKKRHELGHTKTEKVHNCAYCAKYDSKLSGGATDSLEDNPNQCKQCGKILARPCLRRKHELSHLEDKPFECQVCGRGFLWKSQKDQHATIHSEKRSHSCSICEKTFKNQHTLREHEKTHGRERPHKCRFCDKAFLRHGDKEIHERRHLGEKPCMCRYCGMCFTAAGELKYHEMIHTGEKPHRCSFCDKRFITAKNKIRHEKVHVKCLGQSSNVKGQTGVNSQYQGVSNQGTSNEEVVVVEFGQSNVNFANCSSVFGANVLLPDERNWQQLFESAQPSQVICDGIKKMGP